MMHRPTKGAAHLAGACRGSGDHHQLNTLSAAEVVSLRRELKVPAGGDLLDGQASVTSASAVACRSAPVVAKYRTIT